MKKYTFIIIVACVLVLAACQSTETEGKMLTEIESTTGEKTKTDSDKRIEQEERQVEEVDELTNEVDNEETTEKANKSETTEEAKTITWGEFFDDGDHTKPSEKFSSLKGGKVSIEGWMGEVLHLRQGWFLLIREPGGECPFCTEDESFWNEILIVFVEDPSNLRYTKEPLLVEGTLDVGVKIDESNYKTMFRLYDATFKPM